MTTGQRNVYALPSPDMSAHFGVVAARKGRLECAAQKKRADWGRKEISAENNN